MTIESLTCKSWQCHSERTIEFSQITVFVGENDCGKSSLLRALLFVMLNQWNGRADTHVTFDEYESILELGIDGHIVRRSKGDNTNSYGLDAESYEAFRLSVPHEIAKLLNVSIDNFQQQDDPPFWLNLTSGQAASALNDIFCLTAIDDALANAASELRQVRTEKKVAEERLETARANSKTLYWTKQANIDLRELEELHVQIGEITTGLRNLTEHLSSLEENEANIQRLSRSLVAAQDLLEGSKRLIAIQAEISRVKEILSLEDKITNWSESLYQKQQLLDKAMSGKCPLCKRG